MHKASQAHTPAAPAPELPFGATLRKLIWILPISFAVPVVILLLAVTYASDESRPSKTSLAVSAGAIAKRIAPVARVMIASSPTAAAKWGAASLAITQAPAAAQHVSAASAPASTETGGPSAMLALTKRKNCLACHALDHKVVGPAYQAVAAQYAGKPGAEQMLVSAVLLGHVGTWGPVPMPANADVTPAPAKALVTWILGLN
ncbi:cytochrome c-551 precursor [mine drainage metagenome]|uniref:Cytochrome c-551 n=1 Tax=mine drainage metagenome TaxID=410659 RepID=A0A1J5QL02_9ZZZZ